MVHQRRCLTNRDSLIPIHKLSRQLESQGAISRTHSPFNSPTWPVQKSNGEWRLMVDYRGLNEVTLSRSAALPDMLELQYEQQSKAAKWYATTNNHKCVFLNPFDSRVQATVCFHLEGHPVYLESTAPGVETQPHHLPWADPDHTGTG
ncbi:hypothetical protein GRJ2_001118000 [Grus japonensis]|uniref:Reverse transcriptase n=1 Tax=Grus japonensis TaxID=30415 RepID=A0ABC9WN80_GRUJA